MSVPPEGRRLLRPPPLVGALAFAKLAVLLWCASAYGYARSELFDLACARRLAWGFVDQPPLSLGVLAFVQRLYGETILSLRVVPALSGAVVIVLAGRLAARFGAGKLGQGLAALSVLVAPGLLTVDHVFSARSLEVVLWTATVGLVARAVTAEPGAATLAWLRAGVMAGLACLNGLTAIAWVLALGVGVLVSEPKRWVRHRGPWLALGVAAVMLSPYLAWQQAHGWPTREMLANAARARFAGLAPFTFVRDQLIGVLPTNAVVWGAGLYGLLRSPKLRPYRFLGVAFVVLFVAFAGGGRLTSDWLLPAYPGLLAAGAATLDGWLSAGRARYPVAAGALVVTGAAALPLAIPIFRVAATQAYARALHVAPEASPQDPPGGSLPRHFAEMYGWPELARAVSTVLDQLPYEDRRDAALLAGNEGEAGALEMFGSLVSLPPVISGDNQYWLWGPGIASGRVVVAVGGDEALLRASFATVEVATVFGHSLAVPSERHVRVYVCRDSVAPLDVLWPSFRRYG